jgi:3-deoxy-7-phosphoheptulonate synthase
VRPLALAAVAAGAGGLIIEVHPDPAQALSDGSQSLDFASFGRLMTELSRMCGALGLGLSKVDEAREHQDIKTSSD